MTYLIINRLPTVILRSKPSRMWSCRFITCFVTVFAIVIAITKDLADVEGDRRYNIKTLATTLGVRNIAFLGEQDSLASQPCLART